MHRSASSTTRASRRGNPVVLLHRLGTATALWLGLAGLAYAGSRALGDLTPGSTGSYTADSSGFGGAYLDGVTYFPIGCQLWRTDGSPAGTLLAVDLTATGCSIRSLVAVNGALLFNNGTQLWRSNGLAGGTAALAVPGLNANGGLALHAWPGKPGLAWFSVLNGLTPEAWRSDGSLAGTVKLAATGTTPTANFLPDHTMAIVGDGLWLADGTTNPASSISSAFTGAYPPAVLGNKLLFSAKDAAHGREPWVSDLTPAGTQLLKDITTGSGDTANVNFGPTLGGLLFFKGYDYLWKTDGTPAGTAQLSATGAVIVQTPIGATGDASGNQAVFVGKQADGKYYWWRSGGNAADTYALSATPINDSGTYPVQYFSQRKNDALYCTDGEFSYSTKTLVRQTGNFNFATIGYCYPTLSGARRNMGDIELVATSAGLDVLRDAKPRISNLYFPASTGTQRPGLPGGALYYFAQYTATTGYEPWSMDLTDADAPACSYPGKTVPDNNASGRTDTLYFPQSMKAGRLRVYLNLPHTYIGDLSATLTHVESGKTVQLLAGQAQACPSNDLDVVLDDSAGSVIGADCNPADDTQAYAPGTVLRPQQALATFAGDDLGGSWRLKVVDEAGGDSGGIDSWCLQNIDRIFFDDFQ